MPPAKTPRKTGTAPKAKKAPAKKPVAKNPKATTKNPVGRPPAFTDKEDLQRRIQEYFDLCGPQVMKDKDGNPVFTQYGKPVILSTKHPSFFAESP